MASPAAKAYAVVAARAEIILSADRGALTSEESQALYGASFVAQVAAWNAYVVSLIDCFFRAVATPSVAEFHAMHTLASDAARSQVERFNTPNAENTRNLILGCTGFDPWTKWHWRARGLNAVEVRLRLNEILRVRHSLAHGSSMPTYAWMQTKTGRTRLTLGTLRWTSSFFNHLVKATDNGLKAHVVAVYGTEPAW